MKRINAKLFADMWLSEAITDEQRELAARVAKSAMEFPEDKTHIDKFIEKRLEETTGPEHYYLEKLVKDYKEMQITQQANTITQPENCLLYGGVCCYPIEACSECPKHYENAQPNVHDLPKDENCISRQDAIDAVEFGITYAKAFDTKTGEMTELFEESNEELRKAVKRLRELPPAQPRPDVDGTLNITVQDYTMVKKVVLREPDGEYAVTFERPQQENDGYTGAWIKEEDVLKFYYVESLDDYWIGRRLDTMYYATWNNGLQSFVWSKSRYLPWGEHIVAPDTAWKEYTYPSEPKEINFVDWIKGFYKKHFATKWIPVAERLPEMYDAGILKKMGIQKRSKYVFITIASGDEKLVDADAELRDGKWHSDTLRWISADGRKVEVTAWMPYPEPYSEETDNGH